MNLSIIPCKFVEAGGHRRRYDPTVEIKWIDDLPHDLIVEILSRLPAKDLCKFRCVCKSWRDLFTRDKEFMSRHIRRSRQEPLLLVRRYISHGVTEINNGSVTIELTSMDMHGDIMDKFREIIDGLVNTFVSDGPLIVLCCVFSLYVCNPSIRKIVRVPYRPVFPLTDVGFGYLPKTNEYKIVHMLCTSFDGAKECRIFSFGSGESVASGSWNRMNDSPFVGRTECPVCVDGVIYWSLSSASNDKSILCLDLEKEEYSNIYYPKDGNKKYNFFECVGLMGELCVVGFSEATMDIWTMKDENKNIWGIEYSVNLSPLCPKFLIPCDNQSEEMLVHMEEKDMICYGVRSRVWRAVGYYKAMSTYNKPSSYYGSLIPL